MADNLIQLPPEVLAKNADWADRFGGGTTNAVLRTKHNDDQAAYAQALQRQQQEHMANLIATDKNAFAIHKGQQELDMQRETHDVNMAVAAQKLQADAELHKYRIAEMQARTSRLIAEEKLKATAALNKEQDTAGFVEHINQAIESGAKPGTRDFQDYVLKGITSFPNADANLQKEIIGQAKINMTPEEIQAQVNALPDDMRKDIRFNIGSDGKTTVTAGSTKSLTPNAQLLGFNQQITQARAQQRQIDKQIGMSMDDAEIASLKAKRDALDATIDTAAEQHQKILSGQDSIVPAVDTSIPTTSGPLVVQPQAMSRPTEQPPMQDQAIAWAKANATDPRAQKILSFHGVKVDQPADVPAVDQRE